MAFISAYAIYLIFSEFPHHDVLIFIIRFGQMDDEEITQSDMAEWIERGLDYVNQRMTAKKPFTIWEVYIICDKLHIPVSEIGLYFPPTRLK